MRTRKINQAHFLIDPQVIDFIKNDPVSAFSSMSKNQRRILDCLLYWNNQGTAIHIRQDTIAKFVGVTREYVNKVLGWFIELGIITTKYRHMTSCLYKVSSYFNDIKIRTYLRKYLPQLAFLSISMFNLEFTRYSSINLLIGASSSEQQASTHLKPSKSSNTYTCAGVREAILKSKGKAVLIKKYVDEISNPVMTIEEKIQLSQYSEAAVRDALCALQRKRDVSNAVPFLIGCARNYKPSRQYGSASSSKALSPSPERERKVIPLRYPAAVQEKDANFWKKDSDTYAHRCVIQIAEVVQELSETFPEGRDQVLARYKAALAQHVEQECHICLTLGVDHKVQWEHKILPRRVKPPLDKEQQAPEKTADIKEPTSTPTPSSFRPTNTREHLALIAGKALTRDGGYGLPRMGPQLQNGPNPDTVPKLQQSSVKQQEMPLDTHTTIELDEPELIGGYDESEYEEIFPLN